MASVGAGTSSPGQATDAICFAKEILRDLDLLSEELKLDLKVRIGMHTGPVVGGVIGDVRMAYDYWGDTMNVAAESRRQRRSEESRFRSKPITRPAIHMILRDRGSRS